MTGIKLILFAQIGSGKDEFVKLLNEIVKEKHNKEFLPPTFKKEKLGSHIRSFVDKNIELLNLPKDKARELYVSYGEGMRDMFNEDIWNQLLYDKIKTYEKISNYKFNIVIADGRRVSEIHFWESRGYIPIGITASKEIRKQRVIDRDGYDQENMFSSKPEKLCQLAIDEIKSKDGIIVENNGSLEEFKSKINNIYNIISGDNLKEDK